MSQDSSKKNVLVVEDLEINRSVILFHLTKLGCQTEVAGNGSEALDICSKRTFDIIFMDIQMPIMDGITAFRNLREMENPNRLTPVVVLSATETDNDATEWESMGFTDILNKPIRRKELQSVLLRWVPS